ncbi:MAG: patatin-like phospholipase family protein [Burkholderiaceae bacterium]
MDPVPIHPHTPASADPTDTLRNAARVPVSLVLGGGGARGLAHIGVIQWLVENDYRIESIAGSSMGALVGGIFATGKLDVYTDWVLALERWQVLRLLDPSFDRTALFKGERIIEVLRELIGEQPIQKLPIRFVAVATDLETGEEVWLRDGKLFDAIRASIATPLVFTPVRLGDRTLVDGALANPVPMGLARADAGTLTIAVNLGARSPTQPSDPDPPPPPWRFPKSESPRTHRIRRFIDNLNASQPPAFPTRRMLDIAFASMEIMQDQIAELKLAANPPDRIVQIPRNACGFYEFWRAAELIALGRARAAEALGSRANDAI